MFPAPRMDAAAPLCEIPIAGTPGLARAAISHLAANVRFSSHALCLGLLQKKPACLGGRACHLDLFFHVWSPSMRNCPPTASGAQSCPRRSGMGQVGAHSQGPTPPPHSGQQVACAPSSSQYSPPSLSTYCVPSTVLRTSHSSSPAALTAAQEGGLISPTSRWGN